MLTASTVLAQACSASCELRQRDVHGAAQATRQFGAPQLIFNYTQAWERDCLPPGNFSDACSLATFESKLLPLWPAAALQNSSATKQVRGSYFAATRLSAHYMLTCLSSDLLIRFSCVACFPHPPAACPLDPSGSLLAPALQDVMRSVRGCVLSATANLDTRLTSDLLERDAIAAVPDRIEPLVSINGGPVRGDFGADNALRSACAAYAGADAPKECSSEGGDPCRRGARGAVACGSGADLAAGRTRCVTTAAGFRCACAPWRACT
jgi:hypothetical protein